MRVTKTMTKRFWVRTMVGAAAALAVVAPGSVFAQAGQPVKIGLLATLEGLYVSPEAGAAVAATARLRREGFFRPEEEVVVFATGLGLKHTDLVPDDYPVLAPDDGEALAALVRTAPRR